MFDENAILHDARSTPITATGNGTGVDMGVDQVAMTYAAHFTAVTGTTPTLDIKIQESDDNSTWRDFLAFPQMTAAGVQYVTGKSNARYRRVARTAGGTTPSFTGLIAVVPAGRDKNW